MTDDVKPLRAAEPYTREGFAADEGLFEVVSEALAYGMKQPRTAALFERLRATARSGLAQAPLEEAWLAGFMAGANAYDRQRVHSSSGVCPACKEYLAEALDQVSRVNDYRLTEDLSAERSRMSSGRQDGSA